MSNQKASFGIEDDTRVESVAIDIVVTFAKKKIGGVWFVGMAIKSPDDLDSDKGVKLAERRLCEAIARYCNETQNKTYNEKRPRLIITWPRQEYLSEKTVTELAKRSVTTLMERV